MSTLDSKPTEIPLNEPESKPPKKRFGGLAINLILVAAIVLPLTFQAVFARKSGRVRPRSRHAERFLTARLAEDRRPGGHAADEPQAESDVRHGDSPLHEKESSA